MSWKPTGWKDVIWALALATQVGGAIAVPVLLGLAVGWWIDNRLHTLPWITLLLTFVGVVVGPIIAYRWVTEAVKQHIMENKEDNT
jgi:ATP synthase protein I